MNIEQIKKDMDSGVLVTKATLEKLVEAASIMNAALANISGYDKSYSAKVADEAFGKVCEL